MFDKISSDDPVTQLTSATYMRRILSQTTNIPLVAEVVIGSQVVPRLVQFLDKEDFPKLQYEAAWALAKIAIAKPDVVVNYGTVPIFVKLLASRRDYVCEKAICALGNVAGHSKHSDYVLEWALKPLLRLLYKETSLSILRIGTWTLLNLCHATSPPVFDEVKPALEILLHSNDEEVLKQACLVVFHLSEDSEDVIQSVIEAGFVPRLIELLQHPSPVVLVPALRNIRNIVSQDNQQTQSVINHGALPIISNLFTRTYENNVKVEAVWTISNITAGTEEQIQSVIDANLIPILVNLALAQNAELDTKLEAVWAISNATSGGSYAQIKYMVEQSCIKPLCDILVCPDLKTILKCLDGLENILEAGEIEKSTGEENCYPQLIKVAGGLQKIEKLQSHENEEIREKALKIMETYGLKRMMRAHTI